MRTMIAGAVLVASSWAQSAGADELLVGSWATHSVRRYDLLTGTYLGDLVTPGLGGLTTPDGLVWRDDGVLLVSSSGTDRILAYDGDTGALLGEFASAPLDAPGYMEVGPDGLLYVCNKAMARVDRFDLTTGEHLDTFAQGGGLTQPVGLAWNDGILYVSSFTNASIPTFDATTGLPLGQFAPLSTPLIGHVTMPGQLWVTTHQLDAVKMFDIATGDEIGQLTGNGTDCPVGHVMAPDGTIIVASWANHRLLRFDADGTFIETFAIGDGLMLPNDLIIRPESCAADCDGSGALDILDFVCFQQLFVNQDPRACDCDTSGGSGVCNILDFVCFQSAFQGGCR